MKISLNLDDFSPYNSNLDLLRYLASFFPQFKVTLFTIPQFDMPLVSDWCEQVIKAVNEGWLEIGLHGLLHCEEEFYRLSYEESMDKFIKIKAEFDRMKIPTTKLFKAPWWALSDMARKALLDFGLKNVESNYFTWNMKDPMPNTQIIIAHGHIDDQCGNGLQESLVKIKAIPNDSEWIFLSKMEGYNVN